MVSHQGVLNTSNGFLSKENSWSFFVPAVIESLVSEDDSPIPAFSVALAFA